MKRYKLVRVVEDKFYSANTIGYRKLEYKVGNITSADGDGIACYKLLKYPKEQRHIRETMHSFNDDKPVAILEVEPLGKAIHLADRRYRKGFPYEGGINYFAVHIVRVVCEINLANYRKLQ